MLEVKSLLLGVRDVEWPTQLLCLFCLRVPLCLKACHDAHHATALKAKWRSSQLQLSHLLELLCAKIRGTNIRQQNGLKEVKRTPRTLHLQTNLHCGATACPKHLGTAGHKTFWNLGWQLTTGKPCSQNSPWPILREQPSPPLDDPGAWPINAPTCRQLLASCAQNVAVALALGKSPSALDYGCGCSSAPRSFAQLILSRMARHQPRFLPAAQLRQELEVKERLSIK